MARVLMLARVDLVAGDAVRYMPRFHDMHRGELAEVEAVLDASDAGLCSLSPFQTPYWLQVRFKNSGIVKTLNAQLFIIEEFRCTQSVQE